MVLKLIYASKISPRVAHPIDLTCWIIIVVGVKNIYKNTELYMVESNRLKKWINKYILWNDDNDKVDDEYNDNHDHNLNEITIILSMLMIKNLMIMVIVSRDQELHLK